MERAFQVAVRAHCQRHSRGRQASGRGTQFAPTSPISPKSRSPEGPLNGVRTCLMPRPQAAIETPLGELHIQILPLSPRLVTAKRSCGGYSGFVNHINKRVRVCSFAENDALSERYMWSWRPADLAKPAPKIGFSRHKNSHNRSRLVWQDSFHPLWAPRRPDVSRGGRMRFSPSAQRPVARYR
jgi:hypothetical protein